MDRNVAILAGTTVFAAVLAFVFWHQLRTSNRLIGELRQQVEELATAQDTPPVPAAEGGVAPQPAAATVVAPVPPDPEPSFIPANRPVLAASNCNALRARVRQSISDSTSSVAAELNLNPSEVQRLVEIRVAAETVAAGRNCPSGGGVPASQEVLQAEFEAVLGPERFEQLQELNAVRAGQGYMSGLETQLKESGVPLDAQQSKLLMTTILDERRRFRHAISQTVAPSDPYARLAYEEETLKLTEEQFARAVQAAQSYLRPEQLAQLRGNVTREANRMRASLEQLRAAVEAGRPIPPPPRFTIIPGPLSPPPR